MIDRDVLELCIVKSTKVLINYEFDSEFVEKISESMLKCSQVKASEYSLVDIEMEYPLASEIAISLVNSMKHDLSISISENVLIKIILLIACSMEKGMLDKESQKKRYSYNMSV